MKIKQILPFKKKTYWNSFTLNFLVVKMMPRNTFPHPQSDSAS